MSPATYDSVPLGQAGTGAAFELGPSTAIQQGMDYLDQQQKDAQQAQANAKLQAQQMAKDWQANRVNIKAGTLWQSEINDKANAVMQLGLQLRQQGLDPAQYYTDPDKQAKIDDYNQKRQEVMNMAEARDKYAEQAKGVDKMIDESVPGDLDASSIAQYHDFFKQKLSDIMANGTMMPNIKKAYNMQKDIDALPTSKTETTGLPDKNGVATHLILPNEQAHLSTATNFVNNRGPVRAQIEQQTGVPFDQIGTETDPAVIKQQLDDHYRSLPNIPSLAAQGINTYGSANTNSNGVPDTINPPYSGNPSGNNNYDAMITQKAKQMAYAAKVKQNTIDMVKNQLDDKVGTTNDKKYEFAFQNHQLELGRYSMEAGRYAMTRTEFLKKQQNEAGTTFIGNQNSNVPVPQQWRPGQAPAAGSDGTVPAAGVALKPGASLFGQNLPDVETNVMPGNYTDLRNGRTLKNAQPMQVKVSQMKVVPVWAGLDDKQNLNGTEVSKEQLDNVMAGKDPNKMSPANIVYQPWVYGTKIEKSADGVHTVQTPIKFSYGALKGSGGKQINTATFDKYISDFQQMVNSPDFKSLSPQLQNERLNQIFNRQ